MVTVGSLSVVGVYQTQVNQCGKDGEEEHGKNMEPGLVHPCIDAFYWWKRWRSIREPRSSSMRKHTLAGVMYHERKHRDGPRTIVLKISCQGQDEELTKTPKLTNNDFWYPRPSVASETHSNKSSSYMSVNLSPKNFEKQVDDIPRKRNMISHSRLQRLWP